MSQQLLAEALDKLKQSGLDYFCITSDKEQIGLFSNVSIKEATILLYALSKQSEDFKTAIQATFYQLQKDKDKQCPPITHTLKGIN